MGGNYDFENLMVKRRKKWGCVFEVVRGGGEVGGWGGLCVRFYNVVFFYRMLFFKKI